MLPWWAKMTQYYKILLNITNPQLLNDSVYSTKIHAGIKMTKIMIWNYNKIKYYLNISKFKNVKLNLNKKHDTLCHDYYEVKGCIDASYHLLCILKQNLGAELLRAVLSLYKDIMFDGHRHFFSRHTGSAKQTQLNDSTCQPIWLSTDQHPNS